MKLKFLGVRGSRPTHKRGLLGYGGNSTSLELIVNEDFHLFVDGGSGLVGRGHQLGEVSDRKQFHFLITHTHWDHILGFPFFQPFYSEKNAVTFYASNTTRANFTDLFLGLQREANLPVPLTNFRAPMQFQTIAPGHPFAIGSNIVVKTFQINHQGVTLAYRIESGRSSVCIVTDNAPIEGGNLLGETMRQQAGGDLRGFEKRFNDGLVDFLRGAHTVVFDTHFTDANLKPDWGHSTPEHALHFCEQAGVRRLILFHHAPEDQDADVDHKVQSIFGRACRSGLELEAAKEGDEWDLCA